LTLVKDNPTHIEKYLTGNGLQRSLLEYGAGEQPEHYSMPAHHPVLDIDIGLKGMEVIRKAYEITAENYEELISLTRDGQKNKSPRPDIRTRLRDKTKLEGPGKIFLCTWGKRRLPIPGPEADI